MSANPPSTNDQQGQTQSPGGEQAPGLLNEIGLDANEAAVFDSMRTGADLPDDVVKALDTPAVDPAAPSGDGVTPPPDPATKPAAAAPAAEDEEDDGTDEIGDQQSPDQQPKYPKRVAFSKHKRILDKKEGEISQLREKLEQFNRDNAKINERLAILNEALRSPPPQQQQQRPQDDDPRPPAEDVFATIEWLGRQNERLAREVTQMKTGQQQERQQQTETQAMDSFYREDAGAAMQNDPEFIPAYNYLMQLRDHQMKLLGYTDERERRKAIREEEQGIVRFAMTESQRTGQRVSPAKLLKDLAMSMGFKYQAPPPPGGAQPGAAPAAAAPGAAPAAAPAPAAPAKGPTLSDQIQRVRQAQDRNLSLSDGAGAPPPTIDTATLAALSEEEFGHMIENLPKERLRDLMGR